MTRNKYWILITGLIVSQLSFALTPDAEKGKASVAVCLSCHNATLEPPKAPPFFGVKNRYIRDYQDKEGFIKAITDWVKNPSEEKALMKRPVKILGVMPAMPLPDDMLNQIASYLYEEQFDPPCEHWSNELSRPSPQGKGKRGKGKGKNNHEKMVQNQYNKFCNKD